MIVYMNLCCLICFRFSIIVKICEIFLLSFFILVFVIGIFWINFTLSSSAASSNLSVDLKECFGRLVKFYIFKLQRMITLDKKRECFINVLVRLRNFINSKYTH